VNLGWRAKVQPELDVAGKGDNMKDMSTVALGNLVSVSEAASLLGIHRDGVLRYIRQQRLRAEQVAGRWLIDAESLNEFASKPRQVGNPNFSAKSS
jgi:excisionase family DNA binding protein